jgi:hypothetical protein
MEQARPDSTVLPAAQIDAEHGYDRSHDRDERITRLLTARPTAPLPEPGSAEAKAAWRAACHEHTIRTQFANEYPELNRTPLEWWTFDTISTALETGELTPAECARLYPLATERELRMAQIEHELNLAGLFALAYAEHYPVAISDADPDTTEEETGSDAELLRLGRQFEAASARETAANEACNAAEASQPDGEPIPKTLDDAANDAGDEAAALAERIAALPARTAAGFRVKLGALAYYSRTALLSEIPVEPDPDQLLAHSLWRDVQCRGFDTNNLSDVASTADVEADEAIVELAAEFCRAYRRHGEIDRAMMAGTVTEEAWKPHHDAITTLADKLAATTPTTMIGMALKCLGPIGLLAWQVSANDGPARLAPHERMAAEFEAAVLDDTLTPILSDPSSRSSLRHAPELRAEIATAWGA